MCDQICRTLFKITFFLLIYVKNNSAPIWTTFNSNVWSNYLCKILCPPKDRFIDVIVRCQLLAVRGQVDADDDADDDAKDRLKTSQTC